MKTASRTTYRWIGLFVASVAFACNAFAAGKWSVSLAGTDNELVRVKVLSPKQEGSDSGPIVHNLRFTITFYDQGGKVLETQTYLYLDDQLRTLVPGLVYQRFFIHGLKGVDRVQGVNLEYTGYSGGGGALTVLVPAEPQDLGDANRQVVKPAQRELTKYDRCKMYAD